MKNTRIAILILISLCLTNCSKKKSDPARPNIIVILTDDQGWGDLSFNGNTNLNTPNIDSLGLNGVSFDNFFVQPVCSPTRAELLTGIYHSKLGVYSTSEGGERMRLGVPTIAEIFKKNGYTTAAYGKWHNGMQPPYHPNSRGFDDYYGFCSGHWGNYFDPLLEHNGKIVKGEGFLPDNLFSKAIDFVNHNKENPFFLYIPVNTPHSPMQVPDEYWKKFESKELKMKHHNEEIEDENFSRAALSMVENVDWNVGRLMNSLKDLELDSNTIVVFLSDNGPNSNRWNGGLKGKKGSTDEGGVKTSFFMQWPGKIQKGIRISEIAGAIDLLPTLTNLAQLPDDGLIIDGNDLSSLVLGSGGFVEPRTIFNHWNGKTSLRTQNYRLDNENRLFDMNNDLGQHVDISNDNKFLVDSLIEIRRAWEAQSLISEATKNPEPFTLGYKNATFTQIPARDGTPYGNIIRSNRWPNDSFFTNWTKTTDSITWPIKVLSAGIYKVEMYYTCKAEHVGSQVQLNWGNQKLSTIIKDAHDPPLKGMEHDKSPRIESYVKDFIPIVMGEIELTEGTNLLTLTSPNIINGQTIDFRLLQFEKLNP
ncbi:arylsulfatase [Croceivirga thetidis]|uniref:Arylsulfatase n=1 Tax=Croceivirga thetidis TaxID=2721623 RepID=A0ABX1GX75_9FLAO|nr:arylsulfatase [Croceivirga thetidis]NKI33312.1 arylsulfatase [Croceivirga thetidis]